MSQPETVLLGILVTDVLERAQRPLSIRELIDELEPLCTPTYSQVKNAALDAAWSSSSYEPGRGSRPTGPVQLVPTWALVDPPRKNAVAFVARSVGMVTTRDDLEALYAAPAHDRPSS